MLTLGALVAMNMSSDAQNPNRQIFPGDVYYDLFNNNVTTDTIKFGLPPMSSGVHNNFIIALTGDAEDCYGPVYTIPVCNENIVELYTRRDAVTDILKEVSLFEFTPGKNAPNNLHILRFKECVFPTPVLSGFALEDIQSYYQKFQN